MINIGIQTIGWGEEANRRELPRVLAEVAAAGYTGFEIGAQHLNITDPKSLQALTAEHRLEVVGIHVGGEIGNPEAVQQALGSLRFILDYAQAVGATYIPFSGTAKQTKTMNDLRHQADSLNQIGELCRERDLKLCYHNHFWEIHNDGVELHTICKHTDPERVSLCLDVGWIERVGGSPAALVETFFDRIAALHLKDVNDETWLELGAGTVDFAGLFDLIRRRPDWWLIVEQDEMNQHVPAESAKISRDYLRNTFGV